MMTEPQSAAAYLALGKDFVQRFKEGQWTPVKTIKMALLSSFSVDGLKEILFAKCAVSGIHALIYSSGYNQWAQEILNPSSGLYEFSPDLVIVFVDSGALLGEKAFRPYAASSGSWKDWTQDQFGAWMGFLDILKKRLKGKILVHNFEVPFYSPLGFLELKQSSGIFEAVETLNQKLKKAFKKDSQVYFLDYNAFVSRIGSQSIADPKMFYLADMKLDFQKMPELAEDYMGLIRPLLGLAKKCLVMDLDNTLWGGLAGEEGMEGIRLGPSPEGRPYWEFQKTIAGLYDRGVVLALNSRNNPEDALDIIRNHPYMILREEHFAAMRINWEDKVTNLRALASELNLGLESFVFFDDDPANRALVRQALPEVKVIDLPEDPSLYVHTLMKLNDFNTLQLTGEDLVKGRMYAEGKKRRELEKTTPDLAAYLSALEIQVTIEPACDRTIPRIAQLTQKTNQFNMTTRRYQEEEVRRFSRDPKWGVFSAGVRDKCGESGIAAAVLIHKKPELWEIDTFLMSCRIIGRGIEDGIMAHILDEAHKCQVHQVKAEFVPTAKNFPAQGFYARCGFDCIEKKEDREIWQHSLEKSFAAPDFIRVTITKENS